MGNGKIRETVERVWLGIHQETIKMEREKEGKNENGEE